MANQAWQIPSAGKLVLNDLGPIPVPSPNEILIRIYAVSLNYRDVLVVDHSPDYPTKAKPNLIPGSDGAGIIEAVGANSRWKKGDRVVIHATSWLTGNNARDFDVSTVSGGGEKDGTFRRYMLCKEEEVFEAPRSMTLLEASTIFTAGVTAYRALFHGVEPNLGPGSTVLTQGTGGVSSYAIQIAAAAGATVIATSSSDEKLAVAQKLGATHLINYRKTPDWSAEVLKLTDGEGVDIVADVVGGSDLAHSINSLRTGGRVALMGLLDKEDAPIAVTKPVLYGAKIIQGILGAASREIATEFSAFAEKHHLHPPIAQSFRFEEAEQALEALKKLSGVGKVVVEV